MKFKNVFRKYKGYFEVVNFFTNKVLEWIVYKIVFIYKKNFDIIIDKKYLEYSTI